MALGAFDSRWVKLVHL
uniref:Uncharacterized protein n=1 Tax=Arundo donax TaxID=35708 RepID=A0A0A9C7R5_ARUDO